MKFGFAKHITGRRGVGSLITACKLFGVLLEQVVVVAGGRCQEAAPLSLVYATVYRSRVGLEVGSQVGERESCAFGEYACHVQVVDPEVFFPHTDRLQQTRDRLRPGRVQPTGQERRVRVTRKLCATHVPLVALVPYRFRGDHAPGQVAVVRASQHGVQLEHVHRDVVVHLHHVFRPRASFREPRQAHRVLVRQVPVRFAEVALHHVAVPVRLADHSGLQITVARRRQADHEHVTESKPVEHRSRIGLADGPAALEVAHVAVYHDGRVTSRPAAHVAVDDVLEVVQVQQQFPPAAVDHRWRSEAHRRRAPTCDVAVNGKRVEQHQK